MKLISGPGELHSPPQPSCQTSTVRPKAPPTDSRNPSAAMIGTVMLRKIISSSTSANPTTNAR